MLISIGCLMLCAPLDWQYAELPSSASDAVCGSSKQIEKKNKKKTTYTNWSWALAEPNKSAFMFMCIWIHVAWSSKYL